MYSSIKHSPLDNEKYKWMFYNWWNNGEAIRLSRSGDNFTNFEQDKHLLLLIFLISLSSYLPFRLVFHIELKYEDNLECWMQYKILKPCFEGVFNSCTAKSQLLYVQLSEIV